ncbi:MAG: DNA replication/repair protein RecF [Ruminococcaceae bacterium]|nr:DNA replication/repair protein RecF [Oscillospiraceae bacterium]
MFCNKIELKNFRNIEGASVEFTDGVNVLLGSNAQGKTNLLEAIYTASTGKSFRATREAELLSFGCDFALLSLEFTDVRRQKIDIRYFAEKRKQIEINGNKITRLSDMVGRFKCVLFCPEHLSLIKGAPAERRAFLDEAICQLRPMYLVSLTKYEKILKQRNMLLKNAREDYATFADTIGYWSEALAHEAAILSRFRASYASQIQSFMQTCFLQMSEKTGKTDEVPTLVYRGSSEQESYEDLGVTKEKYLRLLRGNLEREIAAGTTLYGVHKDDLEICLGGKPARQYASQGQQRSLALALKLAEGEISKKESGEYPVFLLDDVLSELDFSRRAYLIEEIRDKQVIMTTCEIRDENYTGANIIHVKDGVFEGGSV